LLNQKGNTRYRMWRATEGAWIDIAALCTRQIGCFVVVSIEKQAGITLEEAICLFATLGGLVRHEKVPVGREREVEKFNRARCRLDAGSIGPSGDGRPQFVANGGVRPLLVRPFAQLHPLWARLGQTKGIPGIMVAHQAASGGSRGEDFETFTRVGANADGIAGVDKKINPKTVDGGERGLQGR
jgi:hypothetical protein